MTTPVVRFKTQHLADWLETNTTLGAQVFTGKLPQNMPNRVIGVVRQPGLPLTLDGLEETPFFSIQCRGAENNYSDAEDIALEVDSLIIRSKGNFDIDPDGLVHVDIMDRTGGGPQALPIPDATSRWVFTCNYYVTVFTNF